MYLTANVTKNSYITKFLGLFNNLFWGFKYVIT